MTMMDTPSIEPAAHVDPESWIKSEYLSRRKRNAAYSLRAFAAHLEISVGQLSEIMGGKRKITPVMMGRIADRLALRPALKNELITATADRTQTGRRRGASKKDLYTAIPDDIFEVIADWPHFAILNLLKLKTFNPDPKWIAARLGLSTTEVRDCVNRLERVGMIKKDQSGIWKRTKSNYVSTYGVPSLALRMAHRQDIEKSLDALENVPFHLRDISSITFPADLAKFPEVVQQIKLFQRRMARLMETSDATSVYNLNVQLIPITKERSLS